MKIQASVGNAPASASLNDTVYSLKLTAQTHGEKAYLARLLKAVNGIDARDTRLRKEYPPLRISEAKKVMK